MNSTPPPEGPATGSAGKGPRAKLFWLTAAFVMLAVVLAFVPSVANFRQNWLMERLAAAQIASLAVEAAPTNQVPDNLRNQLLMKAQVYGIAVRRGEERRLVFAGNPPQKVAAQFNLENASRLELIGDALAVFISEQGRVISVTGRPDIGDDIVEVVMTETPLQEATYRFGRKILALLIVISIFTAILVWLTNLPPRGSQGGLP